MTEDPFLEFKNTFFEECDELLADAEARLDQLSRGDRDPEIFHAIFRAVHSIKAGAGAFGFTYIVRLTHNFETLIDQLRNGERQVDTGLIALLVDGIDLLAGYVNCAKTGIEPTRDRDKVVEDRIAASVNAGPAPATSDDQGPSMEVSDSGSDVPAERSIVIEFRPHTAMFRHANEPLLLIRELQSLGQLKVAIDTSSLPELRSMEAEDAYLCWSLELVTDQPLERVQEVFEFVEDDCDLSIVVADLSKVAEPEPEIGLTQETAAQPTTAPQAADAKAPAASSGTSKAAGTSIRVEVDRVDRLVNMVGELVISQSVLAQEIASLGDGRQVSINNGMEILSNHIRELQEQVMAIRMQPVRSVFARMPRVVRDIARSLGKQVRLEQSGEATEVDKTVVEELADPLTHMLRNSLDHGLESPEDRRAAGKPEEGTITMSAEHLGGRIVIRVNDDGRGINREVVLRKAREKGLVPADKDMTAEEIDNLIFLPGFSTASAVTDLSGRGVGMDVVRRNIQKLGGRVSVQSTPGQGTAFQISLPLTLAVLDGMIVGVGDQKYVIPISSIVETVRPRAADLSTLPDGRQLARMRGEYIPIISVADVFGADNAQTDPSQALVVFVEADGDRTVGLVVDNLLGQQQVVIKSLETNFRRVEGIASATILGDGSVYLILDIDQLADMSASHADASDLSTRRLHKAAKSLRDQVSGSAKAASGTSALAG